MLLNPATLILSPMKSPDSILLETAAKNIRWDVVRCSLPIENWKVPDNLAQKKEIALFGEHLFAETVAQKMNLSLLEPPLDFLSSLPHEFVKRSIILSNLKEARQEKEKKFIKPAGKKMFRARICTGAELPKNLSDFEPVLIADPVKFALEFRFFVCESRLFTACAYARHGTLNLPVSFEMTTSQGWFAFPHETEQAYDFASDVAKSLKTNTSIPDAYVLDIGYIAGKGWAVIEANPAWGAAVYGCDLNQVLTVLLKAVKKIG